MQQNLLPRIQKWLNDRGISDAVIQEFQISWDGTHIVIPVHDKDGKVIFNKYRRDPESEEGPKYKYEKGATSALYGVKGLENIDTVVICEGELDALRLRSAGIFSVTSTGGASTFRPEWSELFNNKNTFICLDTDEAGVKGAFNIQRHILHAKIIWLPPIVKDITDFFRTGCTFGDFIRLTNEAKTYPMPKDYREVEYTKKELEVIRKEYTEQIDLLMVEARTLRANYKSDKPIQFLLQIFLTKLGEVKRAIKYFQMKRTDFPGDRIQRAKQVPIPQYIKFKSDGFAKCIWHQEKTASMYYYAKQNRVKCFSCDKLGDVIDVVQHLRSVGLKEALDIILNENVAEKKA